LSDNGATGEYTEPKTRAAGRRIPLSPEVASFLKRHRLASKFWQDDDPIFPSQNGEPLLHRNVTRRGFEAAAIEAGIEGVSFHSLRHAAASRLIAAGLSPVTVAAVLGHAAVVTMKVYAHLFDREKTDLAPVAPRRLSFRVPSLDGRAGGRRHKGPTQKRKRCNTAGDARPRAATGVKTSSPVANAPNRSAGQSSTSAGASAGACTARSRAAAGWPLRQAQAKPSMPRHTSASRMKMT
jgi:hypothetical protein